MLRATLLVLSACFLASFALALDLPSYDDCRGKFYAIRKHEHFGWAEHMRELTPDDGELKEGERLAFQSTLGTFGDTEFGVVATVTELQHLSLVGTSVTDDGLAKAKSLRALKSINIWGCGLVTNKGIGHFQEATSMYSASVGSTRSVDDGWLDVLKHWPGLLELRIDGSPVTGSGFANFKHTPKLEWIEGWNAVCMTDVGLSHIASLGELKGLSLWECRKTTSDGLKKLAACKKMRSMALVEVAGVDDDVIQVISELKDLESLDLCYSKNITDSSAAKLAKCEKLKELDLGDCIALSDETVKSISALPDIVCLKLGDCPKITKACLADILKFKKLERIQVPSAFGDEERETLKKRFPKIQFERFLRLKLIWPHK